jgi:hypothetical protein
MQLRMQLLATRRYLTVLTDSTLQYSAKRWSLKTLPVNLGPRLLVVIVTLKDRAVRRCGTGASNMIAGRGVLS